MLKGGEGALTQHTTSAQTHDIIGDSLASCPLWGWWECLTWGA